MFWRKAKINRNRTIALRALFAAFCLSGFAVFGWGVQASLVAQVILVMMAFVLALTIPAALILITVKLIAYGVRQLRERHENPQRERVVK